MTQNTDLLNYRKYKKFYRPHKEFAKKVAYFSMEFAIRPGLDTYSGGLGFLAGSHMLSAYKLKQNMVGIGMLWKYGYYSQERKEDQTMEARAVQKSYNFLEDTGIEVSVRIKDNSNVKVKAYLLHPEVFQTAPIYFLTTDVDSNDYLSRTITNYLYDSNEETRVAQSIVLGIGGAKVLEALGGADVYHLNEGHALPAFYYLRDKGVRKDQMVFTTHTPEKGGNEERNAHHLNHFGFFGRNLSPGELNAETVNGGSLNYTVAALRFAKRSNAVSRLHALVAGEMWKDYDKISPIIPITNAQEEVFWQDPDLRSAAGRSDKNAFLKRKRDLKAQLFEEVMKQTGKIFDPEVLTIVWARRFAGYKRADLLLHDLRRFEKLVQNKKLPLQIVWAGKPYPMDYDGIGIFNHLVHYTRDKGNLAVLVGYEMDLSRKLKLGADVWLNNPRITREASGTSGMTAAMNGAVNLSTNDGWIPEFGKHGINSFVLPEIDHQLPVAEQDRLDSENLYAVLEEEIIPLFYKDESKWMDIVFKGMKDVLPEFGADRMASEYYKLLYTAQ